MAARDKWLLGHLAAGTNGGWWDKWLLDHLAVETFGGQSRSLQKDKWLLGHLAAVDIWQSGPKRSQMGCWDMEQMAVWTFDGQEICYKGPNGC